MRRNLLVIVSLLLIVAFVFIAGPAARQWLTATTPTAEVFLPVIERTAITPTLCPYPTPVPLWVEPVTSPTNLLTQTVIVRIGSGDAVTITTESGVFTTTGDFEVDSNAARLMITLLPETTHHLQVTGHVRPTSLGGCQFGDYILNTTLDRNGGPLTIVQQSAAVTSTTLVTGSVVLNDGLCCVGGISGDVATITAAYSASSSLANVTEMRVRTVGYTSPACLPETELASAAWEPFTTTQTFTTTIFVNWTSFDIHVQYRDALGNPSPVVCDDLAVEGMPPPPTASTP